MGTKKVTDAQWAAMTTADQIRARGPQYASTIPVGHPEFCFYRVEGTVDGNGYGACVSIAARTMAEALATLEREKANPANARYTHWDVLRHTAATRIDLIEPEDYEWEARR